MTHAFSLVARSASAFWEELPAGVRLSGKVLVYSPVLVKSVAMGVAFPDLDLVAPGIGIGGHRWAMTHSALAAWIGKKGLETIDRYVTSDVARKIMKEVTASAAVGFSIGLSFHLLKDALWDAEQSVRFNLPFVGGSGTIIDGTYLDDDLWLGTNGLYAAKATKDILLMGFGDDARTVVAAFRRWREEGAVVQAINDVRAKALGESRLLSEQLKVQIPTDGEPVNLPNWICARSEDLVKPPA